MRKKDFTEADELIQALRDAEDYFGPVFEEACELLEAPKGSIWDIVLIRAGLSKNGNYYSEQVLRDAASMFEGVKVYAYEFQGNRYLHLPPKARQQLPGGFVKNLVGWVEGVRYDPQLKALTGRLHCIADWFREQLVNSWAKRKDLIGFSVDIRGYVEKGVMEGQKVNIVQKITDVNELTAVTEPAAGGGVLRLVAGGTPEEAQMEDKLRKLLEFLAIELKEDEELTEEKVSELLEKVLQKLGDEGEELELSEKMTLDDLKAALEKVQGYLKEGKVKAAQKALNVLIPKITKIGYGYPAPAKEGDDEKVQEAEKRIAELTQKLEEAMKQLDEVTLKLRTKEKAEKIAQLLSESELSEEYISDYFKEKLMAMEGEDEIRKAIEDRVALVKSISGKVKGAGLSEGKKTVQEGNNGKKEITLDDARKLLGLRVPVTN